MNIKTEKNTICIESRLSIPPETAWQILTQTEHIVSWWGDHVYLEPTAGGTFREEWSNGGKNMITSGTITTFNPPLQLTMTWADDDWPGNTTVTCSITEENNATHLLLEHSGWDIHPQNTRKSLMDAHEEGWLNYLHQFAHYSKTIQ